VRDRPLPAVCLIHGEETFLVERALAAARAQVETVGSLTSRTVWGDDPQDVLLDTLATYATPTLFGGTTLLVIRRAEALRGRAEEQVIDLAQRPPPMGHLVVVAPAVDRRRKLFAALLKTTVVACEHPAQAGEQARWLRVLAAERGVRLAAAAGEHLLQSHIAPARPATPSSVGAMRWPGIRTIRRRVVGQCASTATCRRRT
jgi:DNA polymerase III delta subunit